jgi:hypothetical protein
VQMRRDELKSTPKAQTAERPCTCHPSEAPVPCPQKYAYSECVEAAIHQSALLGAYNTVSIIVDRGTAGEEIETIDNILAALAKMAGVP